MVRATRGGGDVDRLMGVEPLVVRYGRRVRQFGHFVVISGAAQILRRWVE